MKTIDIGREPAATKPAATVLLLRPSKDGFEIFMVRRHKKSGFMGGAFVFPGGKLDDEDCSEMIFERSVGCDTAQAELALGDAAGQERGGRALGLFVAAARETFEEAGILLADFPEATDLAALRQRLLDGETFAALLKSADARLRLDHLVAWTRWITPTVEPRRFDARFFVAVAPPGQTGTHDQIETTAGQWMTPASALQKGSSKEIMLPPPTMKSLEILTDYGTAHAAMDHIRSARVPTVQPVLSEGEGGAWVIALPGDPDHPVAEPALPGPTRLWLRDGRWWSTPH